MEGESPKLSGIFRQPPTGQKRFVYLDPRQPKYGFRLEVSAVLPHVCMFAEIVAGLGAGGGAHCRTWGRGWGWGWGTLQDLGLGVGHTAGLGAGGGAGGGAHSRTCGRGQG